MKKRTAIAAAATGLLIGYGAIRMFQARAALFAPPPPIPHDPQRYARNGRALAVAEVLRTLAGGAALADGPIGTTLDAWTDGAPPGLRPALFFAALSLGDALSSLPIGYVEGHLRERRYGLSEQPARTWLIDELKGALIGTAVTAGLAALFGTAVRRAPNAWPIYASLGALPLLILGNIVVPIYVLPLFNRFEPLEGPLEVRLRTLASRYGCGDAQILRMDMSRQTKKANAFVVGIGRTHRIVIGDTLLEHFTDDEITFVVAHELGHYVAADTWRLIGLGEALATTVFIAAYFMIPREERERLRDRPLLLARFVFAMQLVSQALRPLLFAFSRSREWAADRFALAATGDPASGAAAFTRLRDQNLADEDPPRWFELLFGSHPSLRERIAALQPRR